MKIIYSPKCLEYESVGHPESPARVEESYYFLKNKKMEIIEAKPAKEDDLLLVHSQAMIDQVKGGKFFDIDTPNLKGIFDVALLSVGGAIKAMEFALLNKKNFSLMRPPGHHATKNSLGGFCYFNNIAVAVAKALKKIAKVAILDIDCHHGNGTEDIFLGKSNVCYASLHQSPLYPGTGLKSNFNCFNFPLLSGTSEKDYLKTLDMALNKIIDFKPNLLAISAGFDTYHKDPIASLGLEINSYQKIGERLSQLKIPTFAVLEGGYSSDLPDCIYNFILGLEKND